MRLADGKLLTIAMHWPRDSRCWPRIWSAGCIPRLLGRKRYVEETLPGDSDVPEFVELKVSEGQFVSCEARHRQTLGTMKCHSRFQKQLT